MDLSPLRTFRTLLRYSLVAAIFISALPVLAQETRSVIYGRVLDPQAAAVSGAKVVVTNVDTNVSVTLTTNETAYYEAALLLPGNYQVSVEAAGFRTSIRKGIVLQVSSRVEVNMNLELGAMADSVTVVAEAPLVDASSGYSGRVLDNRSATELPVSNSNVTIFARLSPGVQTNGEVRWLGPGDQGSSSDYSVAGKVGGNEWTIDGAPNSSGSRTVGFLPHGDMVSELKVETSGFDASIGHNSGMSISVMTKSGTNQYHGTLHWMDTQDRWNGMAFKSRQVYYQSIAAAEGSGNHALAEQLRASPKMPSGRFDQYTGTIGGPLVIPKIVNGRNKLFFFFGFAGYQLNSTEPVQEVGSTNHTFPTMANRLGDFSQLLQVNASYYQIYDPLSVRPDPARPGHYIRDPIPGNILPSSRITNPMYKTYTSFLPVPNADPISPTLEPVNNYIGTNVPEISTYQNVVNRIDYNYSNKHRFFGRWYDDLQWLYALDWAYQTAPGVGSSANSRHNRSGTIDYIFTPTPTTMIDFAVSAQVYRGGNGNDLTEIMSYKPSDVGLPAYMDQKVADKHKLPYLSFSGYNSVPRSASLPSYNYYRSHQATINATHVHGRHTIRGGFDMRHFYNNGGVTGTTSGSFSFSNSYTRRNDDSLTAAGSLGFSWASFMMGIPSGMSVSTTDSYALHNPYYAGYIMDQFRLTRKLNVTIGLRLEYEQGYTERYNRMIGNFDPTAQLPIAAAAQAAYAKNPIPELPASQFIVAGGPSYVGINGASRQVIQNELMWLPRLAAAYELNSKTVLRGGYGIFYDTNNTLRFTPNQLGFSRSTSTNLTNDFGMTWLAGDPANGISPLQDPFPVRSDGTRFDLPVRTALGNMAVAGSSFTADAWNTKHARQQRWRVGMQRQLGPSMVVEAAYTGSYSDRVPLTLNLDSLPAQYWAYGNTRNDAVASAMSANVTNPFLLANFADLKTSNPVVYQNMSTNGFFTSSTIRKAQLLLPFPLMSGRSQSNAPLGEVRTDEMDLSFERRFSKGFNFFAAYTRLRGATADYFYNSFDTKPSWEPSNLVRPNRFVMTGLWELPFGKGRPYAHGIAGKIFGGWDLGIAWEAQSGALVTFGNLFFNGNPSDITKGDRTLARWFNVDAGFERNASKAPASYQARVFPTTVDGLRADQTNIWSANLNRQFHFNERIVLRTRVDVLNLANRTGFAAPVTDPTSTQFGMVNNVNLTDKRHIQLHAQLLF